MAKIDLDLLVLTVMPSWHYMLYCVGCWFTTLLLLLVIAILGSWIPGSWSFAPILNLGIGSIIAFQSQDFGITLKTLDNC